MEGNVNSRLKQIKKRKKKKKRRKSMVKKIMNKKKNNKGFSLVELIVVVLIIAIIAVALAPQVMKWVGKSKDNVDKNNAGTIKSAVSTGIAEYLGDGNELSAGLSYHVDTNTLTFIPGSGTDNPTLTTIIEKILNGDYPQKQAGGKFRIDITADGAVDVN